MTKDELLLLVRKGARSMSWQEKLRLTVLLSLPAILAQISSVAMQIIDASMLGHLGTYESATVGLVSTTIWLFGGLCSAFATGFAVQVAHRVGAEELDTARNIVRQGIVSCILFGMLLMIIGLSLAPFLPRWLGADRVIWYGASEYFSIVALALPFLIIHMLAAASLRCAGNIKVPSLLNVFMCIFDVLFNYIFIFVLDMGTKGAALGTLVAYLITMFLILYYLIFRDERLRFSRDRFAGSASSLLAYVPRSETLRNVFRIGSPIGLERGVMCGAQIAITSIIAPLGTVAIAANTFGINIESLCYMPGYGVAEATTTLVGQSAGARRKDLMRSFAWMAMGLGMSVMALMGVLMAVFAPEMMSVVTNDHEVIRLGTDILRIEAWAEPMFAASIVAYGAFVGSGNTLVPSLLNLGSIWIVRLSLATILVKTMGLRGVWIAMCIELCWRGLVFIVRLYGRNWSQESISEVKEELKNK